MKHIDKNHILCSEKDFVVLCIELIQLKIYGMFDKSVLFMIC